MDLKVEAVCGKSTRLLIKELTEVLLINKAIYK